MTQLILFAGVALLALASAAPAQNTMDPAMAAPPADAAVPTPTGPTPASDAGAPAPAVAPTDQSMPAPGAAAAPPAGAMSADIQAQWAKYDRDNKGYLTPLEFGEWVMASGGQDMSVEVARTRTGKKSGLPAVKVLNATGAQFGKADSNKDMHVTPDELQAFLSANPAS